MVFLFLNDMNERIIFLLCRDRASLPAEWQSWRNLFFSLGELKHYLVGAEPLGGLAVPRGLRSRKLTRATWEETGTWTSRDVVSMPAPGSQEDEERRVLWAAVASLSRSPGQLRLHPAWTPGGLALGAVLGTSLLTP